MHLLPKTGKIEGGSVMFDGKDIVHASEAELRELRGKDISMIFQDPMTALDPVFKVGTQMIENIRLHDGLDKEAARKRAIEMLKLVSIPNPEKRMDSYPYELSGGMCQRVMIAMAMSCHPKFIIADEPTTALDVTVQAQVLSLLKGLQDTLNTGILLITHNLGIVAELCQKVAVMYAGRIIEYGTVYEVFKHPAHPYTVGLLNAIPRLSGERERLHAIPGRVADPQNLPEGCAFHPRCAGCTAECKSCQPQMRRINDDHYVACFAE